VSAKEGVVASLSQYLVQSCQVDHMTVHNMSHLRQFSEN